MKKIFVPIIVLVLFAGKGFTQFKFPVMEKYKLRNGLEVIFADYGSLPITRIEVYVNTGKKNETPGMQNISGITAEAILNGNTKWNRIEQDNLLYEMGSGISASSNENYTNISADFLNKDIDNGMDLMAAVLLHPTFPKDEIGEQIRSLIDYNKPSKMDIGDLANVFSDYFVFGVNNPLGRYFYEAQLSRMTPEQIREYYRFTFTPKNTKLVISGKPDREKVKKLIEHYFADWTAAYGEVNGVSFEMATIKTKEVAFVNKFEATQSALCWSKKGPEAESKDAMPFRLANSVFNGLLFDTIRAKEGKTYGIGSSYNRHTGLFNVTTQVRAEVTYETTRSFERLLKEFYDGGITAEQLKTAKVKMKSAVLAMQTPGEFIDFINPMEYPDYEKRKMLLEDIEKMDVASVNKIIKKYFVPDVYKLVIVGNEAILSEQLEKLKELKKIPINAIETNGDIH